MKVYKVNHWSNRIDEEKEITRQTELSYFFINYKGKEQHFLKKGSYSVWFESKKEALEYICRRIESYITGCNDRLSGYTKELEIVKQLLCDLS